MFSPFDTVHYAIQKLGIVFEQNLNIRQVEYASRTWVSWRMGSNNELKEAEPLGRTDLHKERVGCGISN